jgi:pentalenene oxygenase
MLVVCCPDLTHRVLRDGRTFDTGGPLLDQGRTVARDALLFRPRGPHQRQRRLLRPAFSQDRLAVYAVEMSRQLGEALTMWRDGQVIDVVAVMDEITARASARTLFTASLSPQQSAELLRCLTAVVDGVFLRMVIPELVWPLFPAIRRFNHALPRLDALTYEIIDAHRHDGVDHSDMLSILLAARDECGDALTDAEIHDQIVSFLLMGTETTATLLAWSFHLLGRHSEAAQRVQNEVDRILDGRIAVYDDVAHLDYTRRVLTETLRLYPPGWMLTRVVTAETTLAGRKLPSGTTLVYRPYLIHRRPDLYPDPDRFDPDRWLHDHAAALPRGAFIPFGGDARKCIGDTFSMLEATLALASITARWRLDPILGVITRPSPRHLSPAAPAVYAAASSRSIDRFRPNQGGVRRLQASSSLDQREESRSTRSVRRSVPTRRTVRLFSRGSWLSRSCGGSSSKMVARPVRHRPPICTRTYGLASILRIVRLSPEFTHQPECRSFESPTDRGRRDSAERRPTVSMTDRPGRKRARRRKSGLAICRWNQITKGRGSRECNAARLRR